MNSTTAIHRTRPDVLGWAARLLSAGLLAIAVFLGGVVFVLGGVRLLYSGSALPGVYVGSVDVSGLSQPEIEAALTAQMSYPQTGRLALRDGSHVWTVPPGEVGAVLDTPAMAQAALDVGRSGNVLAETTAQLNAWFRGVVLPPILIFDERTAAESLNGLAAQIDRPTVEAGALVNGREVQVTPGQIGRQLDIAATLDSIAGATAGMTDAVVDLPVHETPPAILDASAQAEVARQLLSQPFSLTADGAGPWVFEPEELAGLIRFRRVDDGGTPRLVVGLDEAVLIPMLTELGPGLERSPDNARFVFNDDTRQLDLIRAAVIGRELDVPASLDAIQQAAGGAQHSVALVFQTNAPAVGDDATAESLGITENVLLASYGIEGASTYFSGSSPERIQNITTAAAQFHGVLVAPGETFSMGDYLGDVSLDNGYAEALIIYGNRTIKGVGGGVCQVSTTLFRAVFFGGYPIVERHPHAYRVGYYEQGSGSPGPGMDATVFEPLVDFKFTNDTPYWLLMETYIYGNQLLWKFYSTSDGRTVSWSSDRSNKVDAPETIYRENADLPKGKINQVDYKADGLDVVVYRTVKRNGEVLHEDRIKTHYLPWRAIYEFGPGTELPHDAKVEKN
jgi:vancomycin resistance protein YoaR